MKITETQLKRIIREELTRVLAEVTAGTLFVERGNHGYVGLSDDRGNEYSMGLAVETILDAGITNIFIGPQGENPMQLARLQSARDRRAGDADMRRWDSNVFADYYYADNDRIVMEFAKLKNLEIVEAEEEETTDYWDEYPEEEQMRKEDEAEEELMRPRRY